MARTGLVYHPDMLLHDTGPGHPERPARLSAVVSALKDAQLQLIEVRAAQAERKDLLRVHSEAHVATIERTCAVNAVYPDPDTPMGPTSWKAALLAAGGAIAACKAVLDGTVDNVFCAIRPPGHHADRDRAMGFCLFNNVAIAARWLREVRDIARVAIIDWDVHHGNGTQHAFYDDDTVYYVSLHQHPLYPGTGWPEERGKGGTNLNILMRPGTSGEVWVEAMRSKVLPELERFNPGFLLISCGFDAHRKDPLGSQQLEAAHYAEMTRLTGGLLAGGRIVSLLEGGYNLEALAESSVAHARALQGLSRVLS